MHLLFTRLLLAKCGGLWRRYRPATSAAGPLSVHGGGAVGGSAPDAANEEWQPWSKPYLNCPSRELVVATPCLSVAPVPVEDVGGGCSVGGSRWSRRLVGSGRRCATMAAVVGWGVQQGLSYTLVQAFAWVLQVCRGTAVMLVSPTDGTDEIANPFIQPDGA
ncbi:hypothetical protein Cgig2_010449 [Carnegiea gigantea]|uniref:Uncharacterized protein n=1 Tax=Carnegiea gigantea TaxID=171969 RepID=A0A9Q1JZZ5_9CARY|nr:hypothetical protein Cgig2_010449 [Carnegiea gigantea]